MKISYNWLKDYLSEIPSPEETSKILTNTGLEVEGLEKVEAVKGGLEGVVVAEVLSCDKHPDADKLSVTTVNLGKGEPVQIVCGAPNVAAGQKVMVAKTGTTLHMGDKELSLKKVKIRGQVSEGMICAEDELGLGTGHDGIMVLDPNAIPGTPAKEFLNLKDDYVFEIGLTPNRIDGASHIGTARDIHAFQSLSKKSELIKPPVDSFKPDDNSLPVKVVIENEEACIRYSGVSLSGVKVTESPDWLKERLKVIGLNPVNNIVDITNFVMFETGQPLHAFDADKIEGRKVIIKTLPEGTLFTTLDEEERKLGKDDLMICDENGGMCIAGVYGGIDSGVSANTQNVFLESANFNPVYVRKTARKHLLNTDSSFRFERGADPEGTLYALKRAALLIREIAGGKISSGIQDEYPNPVHPVEINLEFDYLYRLCGKKISRDIVRKILTNLDFLVERETESALILKVPTYRVDVTRPADVVEEILRIYGYNQIETSSKVNATISYVEKPDREKLSHGVAELLSSVGFHEIMCNSLAPSRWYEKEDQPDPDLVRILNPLSQDLNCMRKDLLKGGLEAVRYNQNHRNPDVSFFEFGNIYRKAKPGEETPLEGYYEEKNLSLLLSGFMGKENWISKPEIADFYDIKTYTELVLKKLSLLDPVDPVIENIHHPDLEMAMVYRIKNENVACIGKVKSEICRYFEIENPVFYSSLNWDTALKLVSGVSLQYTPFSPFPEVKRDLSMVLDTGVTFNQIREIALAADRNLVREVNIFDVYEGERIEKGKKSYAVSFLLQDEKKTLNDKQIDKVMNKIIQSLESELGARIRK